MSPGLIAAAAVTPLAVLAVATIGYILWRRGVHVRLRMKAASWVRRCFRSKMALRESALPPLTPFLSTLSSGYSRGEKTCRSSNIESSENPFEDSPTSFDLENPPLVRITAGVPRGDELSRAPSARSSSTVQTVRQARIQDQIDSMRAQIEWLISQQQSDWALGLTDEPPPSYRQSDGSPSRFAVSSTDPYFLIQRDIKVEDSEGAAV
jgi:hypothetical protein